MVEELKLEDGDLVIEVGPGDGAVTSLVLQKPGVFLLSIEVDYDLLPNLIRKFSSNENFKLIHKSILDFDLEQDLPDFTKFKQIKVIGSLPFNISKKIIDNFLKLKVKFDKEKTTPNLSRMAFIVQEEVGKDYTAKAPRATFLATYVSLFASTRKLESIPRTQFHPVPKVNGAIIRFEFLENIEIDENLLKFIRLGYISPRKTLQHNLKSSKKWNNELIEKSFTEMQLSTTARASELEKAQWVELFGKLNSAKLDL